MTDDYGSGDSTPVFISISLEIRVPDVRQHKDAISSEHTHGNFDEGRKEPSVSRSLRPSLLPSVFLNETPDYGVRR